MFVLILIGLLANARTYVTILTNTYLTRARARARSYLHIKVLAFAQNSTRSTVGGTLGSLLRQLILYLRVLFILRVHHRTSGRDLYLLTCVVCVTEVAPFTDMTMTLKVTM